MQAARLQHAKMGVPQAADTHRLQLAIAAGLDQGSHFVQYSQPIPAMAVHVSAKHKQQSAAESLASRDAPSGQGAAEHVGSYPENLNERWRHIAVAAGLKEGRREAFLPGAPGPADAVHVGVDVRGQIIVDDVGDMLDVQPARGHVGRHQDGRLALPELHQSLHVCTLA